jgi:hypothetical protein
MREIPHNKLIAVRIDTYIVTTIQWLIYFDVVCNGVGTSYP